MNKRETGQLMRILIVSVSLACIGAAIPRDVLDLETNAQNGDTESVESIACDGSGSSGRVGGSLFGGAFASSCSDHDIRHVVDHGRDRAREVITLTSGPEDDLAPRIAIKSDGSAKVVWWRDKDTDEVLYVARTGGEWSSEQRVSNPGEDSRNPEVVIEGSTTWIAYEIHSGVSTWIAAVGITDGPEPFPSGRAVLGATAFAGDMNVLVHSGSGRVWVTWVDSLTAVGWAQYNAAASTWSPADYEPVLADDVEAARSRIRARVTGALE